MILVELTRCLKRLPAEMGISSLPEYCLQSAPSPPSSPPPYGLSPRLRCRGRDYHLVRDAIITSDAASSDETDCRQQISENPGR